MKKFRPGYADAKNVIVEGFDGNAIMAEGTTVPVDATTGYAPGCLFFKRAGGAATSLYRNVGTATSSNFDAIALADIDLSGLTASAADLNALDVQVLTVGAGAGFTDGVGAVFEMSRIKIGNIFTTTLILDLTGTASSTTDLDIIGSGSSPAYICRLAAAESGTTIDGILMECMEAPAGGVTDIDLYSATAGTGVFDSAVTDLTETALITSGAAWTNGRQVGATTCPAATEYLYLTGGAGGTAATYTAGKFVIRIYGH